MFALLVITITMKKKTMKNITSVIIAQIYMYIYILDSALHIVYANGS
jgi:hypothetical protein